MTPPVATVPPPALNGARDRIAAVIAGIATLVVLLAVGIAPFATPLWMYAAQDRASAEAWTGWPPDTVHAVAGSALADVVIGPGDFAQEVDGRPVFSPAEVSHLRDVRRLAVAFYVVIVASVLAFAVVHLVVGASRTLRAVRTAARILAVSVIVLALVAVFAFEPAFDVAHRLFFAAGTYAFDPATSRMVQLFPEALWFDTALALGVWLLVLSVAVQWFAGTRLRRAHRAADGAVPVAPLPRHP